MEIWGNILHIIISSKLSPCSAQRQANAIRQVGAVGNALEKLAALKFHLVFCKSWGFSQTTCPLGPQFPCLKIRTLLPPKEHSKSKVTQCVWHLLNFGLNINLTLFANLENGTLVWRLIKTEIERLVSLSQKEFLYIEEGAVRLDLTKALETTCSAPGLKNSKIIQDCIRNCADDHNVPWGVLGRYLLICLFGGRLGWRGELSLQLTQGKGRLYLQENLNLMFQY